VLRVNGCAKTMFQISECVNAKKFMDENNSYIYQNSALKEGETYNLKVKMRTVGTISGNYTKVFTFTYGEKPGEFDMLFKSSAL